ncbi:tRNA (guanosine(37)-N1)-methyltransferase TrmD [Candidatus Dojkabacteria bacterium]|nr:tRNA (guanosine(37)-N1)-methyltransferase TrmD [Candidatus Dojkabacteria bacterium]
MKIDILTIFPEMFEGPFSYSIIERAQEAGLLEIDIHDLRNWAEGKHKKVDDTPYGGGGGMVMMIEPIHKALKELKKKDSIVIATTAKGETYKQSTAKNFATHKHLIIICGHYEGFDQRILDELVDYPASIGNYVLTGGEIPAMVIVDSVVRLLPGAVGNEETPKNDSFYEDDKTIQYPIYTKPAEYDLDGKVLKVPGILLSGDHKEIQKWRNSQSQ